MMRLHSSNPVGADRRAARRPARLGHARLARRPADGADRGSACWPASSRAPSSSWSGWSARSSPGCRTGSARTGSAVRPAPDRRRRDQAPLQRGHRPGPGGQDHLGALADRGAGRRADGLGGHPVVARRGPGRSERRRAVPALDGQPAGHRRGDGRLGLEQQVRAAGRDALGGAARELRDSGRAGGAGAGDAGRHDVALRHRRGPGDADSDWSASELVVHLHAVGLSSASSSS